MSDDDNQRLLDLWKKEWTQAGWEPVLLTLSAARSYVDYDTVQDLLVSKNLRLDPMAQVYMHRWMAMIQAGGGWYADYDVFPIPGHSPEWHTTPSSSRMTLYDIYAPTLAHGTKQDWKETFHGLPATAQWLYETERSTNAHQQPLQQAEQPQNTHSTQPPHWYFTDSLGIHQWAVQDIDGMQWSSYMLLGNNETRGSTDNTLPRLPSVGHKRVLLPLGRTDPVRTRRPEDCTHKTIRSKWVLHVPSSVIHSSPIEHWDKNVDKWRHPSQRAEIAKQWLSEWRSLCTMDQTVEV